MVRIFRPNLLFQLRKKWNDLHHNQNTVLHFTLKLSQALNSFISPFVFQWNEKLEMYTISKKVLKVYWLVPIFKFVHIIFLSKLALFGPFNPATKLSVNAPAIMSMNIIILLVAAVADVVVIVFVSEFVNCFNWAYKITNDFLSSLKFRKYT